MSNVLFYEKPGCINNRKQKALLVEAGVGLDIRNLLTTNWRRDDLRQFFGDMPVSQWFNRSAPVIKNGELDPDAMDGDSALEAMLNDPLLIRRPLMKAGERHFCGFDLDAVLSALGKSGGPIVVVPEGIETCPRTHSGGSCGEVERED